VIILEKQPGRSHNSCTISEEPDEKLFLPYLSGKEKSRMEK
jgi:hypothetical protein